MKEDHKTSPARIRAVICAVLAAITFAVYFQTTGFDFISLDDPGYIVDNEAVRQGLTVDGLRWSFLSFHESNWHPLTWISHMLDVRLFGLNPGMHHLTNVLFHVLNTALLFLVLHRMTGAVWKSAAVAALFALHPLHVESVAWISERKDVLSTFFWMLTMAAYLGYVQRRTVPRYLLMALFFILGLMSKPMLVTLPFVLLLLDLWPLKRWRPFSGTESTPSSAPVTGAVPLRILFLEKAPLIALSAASSLVTVLAQKAGGAVKDLESMSVPARLANAVVSCVRYLGMTVWPHDLAVYYPFQGDISPFMVTGCLLFLLLLTALAVYSIKKAPYLTVGWLWYIGTLLPVIGIVQVGSQSMADRYTYVPLIGVFIAVTWGLTDLSDRMHLVKAVLPASTVAVLTALAWATWVQAGLWKDSETLFRHTLSVTSGNYLVHYDLGYALYEKGDVQGAVHHYQEALRIRSDLPQVHNNLGGILLNQGDSDGAIRHYVEALKIDPHQARVYNNLGIAFIRKGRTGQAVRCFERALQVDPGYRDARNNLEKVKRKLQAKTMSP